MLMTIIFLSSCAASTPNIPAPAGISKIDINAQEFGLGEFMSSERTIHTVTVDDTIGAQYELIDAITKEGDKKSHIGFYRTKVLNGENIKQATNRVQEICSAAVKKSNLPEIEKTCWHNKKTDKVSCLIFKKDNMKQ
ncbi:MAG TPA: hypothetical protein DDY52_01340 [Candidatus Moranbacteria bacterium]|nr:hypothetical protein [Candidatus Moranbacteria bacterium]